MQGEEKNILANLAQREGKSGGNDENRATTMRKGLNNYRTI
jgi:hypothetical protein